MGDTDMDHDAPPTVTAETIEKWRFEARLAGDPKPAPGQSWKNFIAEVAVRHGISEAMAEDIYGSLR